MKFKLILLASLIAFGASPVRAQDPDRMIDLGYDGDGNVVYLDRASILRSNFQLVRQHGRGIFVASLRGNCFQKNAHSYHLLRQPRARD